MQTILCKGRYHEWDVMYILQVGSRGGFNVIVTQGEGKVSGPWVFSLGHGIDQMVRWCNLQYSQVMDMVQQAIRRMHMEERLCSVSRPPATPSCQDTGACGQ